MTDRTGKTERVSFRCAPGGAELVRVWAAREDLPVSAAWRRVMRAGIVALGIAGPGSDRLNRMVVRTGRDQVLPALRRIADMEPAPSRRPASAVWTGPVDADGNPMPEEGQ